MATPITTSIIQLVGLDKEYIFTSVRIGVDGTQNGTAIALGGLSGETGYINKDVYAALTPATANLAECDYLVAKEFIAYIGNEVIDQLSSDLDEIVKAVKCKVGQVVTISNDGFTGTPVVGGFISPVDGTGTMVATATQTPAVVAYEILLIDEPIRIGQRSTLGSRLLRVA